MYRNPLRDQAMLSAREPDDVLTHHGLGADLRLAVLIALVILVVVGVALWNGAGGGSPSPSPSPAGSIVLL
jgi:hypothetical protein